MNADPGVRGGSIPALQSHSPIGFHKNYLNNLLCACAPDNGFAQDAIEHAILTGQVQLSGTYSPALDAVLIMERYDSIASRYHAVPAKLRTRLPETPRLKSSAT